DWRYGLVRIFLIAVPSRPGARLLAGPGEIVVQENAYMTAGFVANLPDPDIGMIDREIGALGESQAEQPARGIECRPHHVVEHEIRLVVRLVEVVPGFPDLLRVVPPVPGLDRLVETLGARHYLERRALVPRLVLGRLPDLQQQPFDRRAGLGHRVVEAV